MKSAIVADAGPLIALARTHHLDKLAAVFEPVLLPQAVVEECCRDLALPGAKQIATAIEQGQLQIRKPEIQTLLVFPSALGPGERGAIELASTLPLGILMDDRLGRRFAQQVGLPVLGTGGLLLLAKQQGVLPTLAPAIADLQATGYHISTTLVTELLRRAGEVSS